MEVRLKTKLRKFVDQQVKEGYFDTADDVINSAVARLLTVRRLAQRDRLELQELADVGLAEADRGEFVEFTAEDVIAERHAALARRRKKGA